MPTLLRQSEFEKCGEEKKARFRDTMAPAQAASDEQRTVQNTSRACEPAMLAPEIRGASTGNAKISASGSEDLSGGDMSDVRGFHGPKGDFHR